MSSPSTYPIRDIKNDFRDSTVRVAVAYCHPHFYLLASQSECQSLEYPLCSNIDSTHGMLGLTSARCQQTPTSPDTHPAPSSVG